MMSEKEPAYHTHPRNVRDLPLFGIKLGPGDTLKPDDVYDSSNGLWERCTCPGLTLQGEGSATIWIRPVPVPPERELVHIGNGVYTERGALPPEPAADENLET
jgi:hypothetical protein